MTQISKYIMLSGSGLTTLLRPYKNSDDLIIKHFVIIKGDPTDLCQILLVTQQFLIGSQPCLYYTNNICVNICNDQIINQITTNRCKKLEMKTENYKH